MSKTAMLNVQQIDVWFTQLHSQFDPRIYMPQNLFICISNRSTTSKRTQRKYCYWLDWNERLQWRWNPQLLSRGEIDKEKCKAIDYGEQ